MPDSFILGIPITNGGSLLHTINSGEVLFCLGANGSGKSSLMTSLAQQHAQHMKRITAHRQTWFESNAVDITPSIRHDLDSSIRSHDQNIQSRWKQWNPHQRTSIVIFDLIDKELFRSRNIAKLVEDGDLDGAKEAASIPAPAKVMNDILRQSNIPVEIVIGEGQKVLAQKNGGSPYNVAELSDGERNAFLLCAEVLTANPGSLIIVDEPERHLHRSIISPLLTLLFRQRKDCAFIVSTHELLLPVDNQESQTLLIRSCVFNGSNPATWSADLLEANVDIDASTKRDILGARSKILFVEGEATSLDVPLYSLLFPQLSVIPKSSCRDVEYAVRGIRDAAELHWVNAWGVVDSDQRSQADIDTLKDNGVFALGCYSVESLYYHPRIVRFVADRQAATLGGEADALYDSAISKGVELLEKNRDHLVWHSVEKRVRRQIFASLPNRADIRQNGNIQLDVDIQVIRQEEEQKFDKLVATSNYEGLIQRYPIRESGALDQITKELRMLSRADYESAVRKLIQDEEEVRGFLRSLFADLAAELNEPSTGRPHVKEAN